MYAVWREWQKAMRGRRLSNEAQAMILMEIMEDLLPMIPPMERCRLVVRLMKSNTRVAGDEFGHAIGFDEDIEAPPPRRRGGSMFGGISRSGRSMGREAMHVEMTPEDYHDGAQEKQYGIARAQGASHHMTTTTTTTTTSSHMGHRGHASASAHGGRRPSGMGRLRELDDMDDIGGGLGGGMGQQRAMLEMGGGMNDMGGGMDEMRGEMAGRSRRGSQLGMPGMGGRGSQLGMGGMGGRGSQLGMVGMGGRGSQLGMEGMGGRSGSELGMGGMDDDFGQGPPQRMLTQGGSSRLGGMGGGMGGGMDELGPADSASQVGGKKKKKRFGF